LPIVSGFHFGPDPKLLPYFHVGHFAYKGDGFVDSLMHVSAGGLVPHVSLLVADQVISSSQGLNIDGKNLSSQDVKHTFVNFLNVSSVRKNEYSLYNVLVASQNQKPVSFVNESDVVLILPLMFTGNTDFKSSPLGDVPGGYVLVAMVQSVLRGQFITSLSHSNYFLMFLSLMSLGLIGFRKVAYFALSWLGGAALICFVGLSLFCFFDFVIPWLQGGFTLFTVGACVTLGRQRITERTVGQITNALSGLVSPALLSELMKNPQRMNLKPTETPLTVMFVDVVGFSMVSETRPPIEVFDLLKVLMKDISQVIHEYGGVIDKTLGDGLICYFGFRFSQMEKIHDHATQALQCALKIQRENAQRWSTENEGSKVVLPLRLGLNSGNVYIGNLGDAQRVDFSLIGHTVNYAKRLEDSCEPFRIMIGKGTFEHVDPKFLEGFKVQQRYLAIKHHVDLWEGFEIDPFQSNPEVFTKAVSAYRHFAGERVKDRRWLVEDSRLSICANGTAFGTLIDFSRTGLSVHLPTYLALKVTVSLDFVDSQNSALRKALQAAGVTPLTCEVRWGRPDGKGFRHGLLIKNLTEERRELLVQCLLSMIEKPESH
jgi:class 3 adenylate cyclase